MNSREQKQIIQQAEAIVMASLMDFVGRPINLETLKRIENKVNSLGLILPQLIETEIFP